MTKPEPWTRHDQRRYAFLAAKLDKDRDILTTFEWEEWMALVAKLIKVKAAELNQGRP
jgi:hypothetical protein